MSDWLTLGCVTSHRGGMKESGIGRENGLEAFEACASSRLFPCGEGFADHMMRRHTKQVYDHQYCFCRGDKDRAGLVCGGRHGEAVWLNATSTRDPTRYVVAIYYVVSFHYRHIGEIAFTHHSGQREPKGALVGARRARPKCVGLPMVLAFELHLPHSPTLSSFHISLLPHLYTLDYWRMELILYSHL